MLSYVTYDKNIFVLYDKLLQKHVCVRIYIIFDIFTFVFLMLKRRRRHIIYCVFDVYYIIFYDIIHIYYDCNCLTALFTEVSNVSTCLVNRFLASLASFCPDCKSPTTTLSISTYCSFSKLPYS